jgi:hypothetical protein
MPLCGYTFQNPDRSCFRDRDCVDPVEQLCPDLRSGNSINVPILIRDMTGHKLSDRGHVTSKYPDQHRLVVVARPRITAVHTPQADAEGMEAQRRKLTQRIVTTQSGVIV